MAVHYDDKNKMFHLGSIMIPRDSIGCRTFLGLLAIASAAADAPKGNLLPYADSFLPATKELYTIEWLLEQLYRNNIEIAVRPVVLNPHTGQYKDAFLYAKSHPHDLAFSMNDKLTFPTLTLYAAACPPFMLEIVATKLKLRRLNTDKRANSKPVASKSKRVITIRS